MQTRMTKEQVFLYLLGERWNNGPFTSEEKMKYYPGDGFSYLDLFGNKEDAQEIVREGGYGCSGISQFGLNCYSDLHATPNEQNEMQYFEFLLYALADELGYEFVEIE